MQSTALVRLVVLVTLIVALFKGLSFHIGETVLFNLPDWLPVLGGPATLEGLASAGLDALQLLAVLAVFTAFSAGADYYALLRSVPAAMHGAGLITSIAITFVPQTVERWGEIREAQSLRGHHVRRATDLLPLVMPLLAGGMERSMNLAEAMEARGFSRSTARRTLPPLLVQLGLAGGLADHPRRQHDVRVFARRSPAGVVAHGCGGCPVRLNALGRRHRHTTHPLPA